MVAFYPVCDSIVILNLSAAIKILLAVTVGGISIAQFTEKSVTDALRFTEGLELSEKEHQIADLILEGRLNLDAVAAGGDSLGFFRDLRHRI